VRKPFLVCWKRHTPLVHKIWVRKLFFIILHYISTQKSYIHQKLNANSCFAKLRANSYLFSFFYTPCIGCISWCVALCWNHNGLRAWQKLSVKYCIKLVCCLASRSLVEGSLATAAINSDQPEVEVASLRSVEFSLFGVQLWRLEKPIFPAPARSGPCN
jgi:hypothetical protein